MAETPSSTTRTRISSEPWYALPEGDPCLPERVFSDLKSIKETWGNRYAVWDVAEKLVGSMGSKKEVRGLASRKIFEIDPDTLTLNYSVIRAVRDAMRSRLATRKTKIRAYTAGARYTVREKARLLTKQVKGMFLRGDVYLKNHQIFNDIMDYGVGYGKPYEISGHIRIDRVHPRTVVMDEPEYGTPSEWYHFVDAPKRQLALEYPELENEIWRSTLMERGRDDASTNEESGDWATIVEAWHCPQDGEGRHVITVTDSALVDDEWKSTAPGVVPGRFYEPSVGFVGDGLPVILGDIQNEVSYLLQRIQDQMDIGGTLKVLVDAGSGLDVEVLSNELIQVLKHNGSRGVPAQILSIPAIDPVYFQELERAEAKAYSLVGLSELWASSEKPAGLNSGRALAEMDQVTSTRFLDIAQVEDAWYLALAKSCVSLASSISGFTVSINGTSVPWADIELDEEEYDLTIAPVSALPDSAPGLIEKILNDAQLDANLAADQVVLLDSIDHEVYVQELIAPKLACEKYLDELYYDHKNKGLKSQLDLAYLERRRVLRWNQAFLAEDETAMDMLDELGSQIISKQKAMQTQQAGATPAQPVPAPGAGGMAGPPAATPGAPPGPGMAAEAGLPMQ